MKLVENYYLPENFPEDTSDTSLRLIGYYFFFMETLAISNSGEIEEFMSKLHGVCAWALRRKKRERGAKQ